MKSSIYLSLVLLASMVGHDLFAQSQYDSKVMAGELASSLIPPVRFKGDSVWTMESRMKHYGVPGLSMAVIKDSKIVLLKSYGIKDRASGVPVTINTLFQAASISKPVSAYAALKEVELGKINADENINVYLKSWKLPDNAFTKTKKVTLKHLLSHSGGITVGGFLGYTVGAPVPTLLQLLNGEKPANSEAIVVDKVPGGSFRYAGGGYCIIQQMLIDIEGKSYPDIMQEFVLGPLEMKNSTYNQPLTTTQLPFAATGYLPDGTEVPGKRHIYPEMAPAGLWTTAEDLAKFVINLQQTLKGESHKVLSQAMAKQMTTPFIEPFEGLGIFLNKRVQAQYFSHNGWNEGFSSTMIGNTSSGDGVVILINGNQPALLEEIVRAVALNYKWPEYEFPVYQKMPASSADLAKISGRYRTEKYGLTKIYEEKGKVFLRKNMEEPAELFKVGPDTYVMRSWEGKIKFMVNPSDKKKYIINVIGNEAVVYENPELTAAQKTPYEFVLNGQFEEGLAAFKKAKHDDPEHYLLREDNINSQGYSLLKTKEFKKAIAIFSINTLLYPESANAFDSLGEAYLANGDKEKAKENYAKAVKLNPNNAQSAKVLRSLE